MAVFGEINNQPNIKIPLYLDSSNGNNMLDISPWQTWSTKRTILVNDLIISNSRIPIKTSPNSTQKSQSRDKCPSKYAHLQVNLAPSENIYFLSFEFTLQSSSSPPLSPCNVSLSKPLLRQHRFRASIESFLSSIMGIFAVCCSYLACNMRAIIPAAKGAAAEVPVCLSVQPVPVPKRQSVVTWQGSIKYIVTKGNNYCATLPAEIPKTRAKQQV